MLVKLTVIIPCYNQESYIFKTLKSVMCQSFKEWECIIIDDGSTDNSFFIIQHFVKLDTRFKYFYQNNSGVSSARNLGISKAKGIYIHLLDADDIIYDSLYESFVALLDGNSAIDLVYGWHDSIDKNDNVLLSDTTPLILKSKHLNYLLVKNIFPTLSAIFRKKVSDFCIYFDVELDYCEDWDFWLRLSLSGYNFYGVNVRVGGYRKHANNTSNNKLKMLKGEECVLIKNKHQLERITANNFSLDFLLNAIHLSAYFRAKKNNDLASIAYLEEKVRSVPFSSMMRLCFSFTTLPSVLNYAEIGDSKFIYFILYIPIKLRGIVRSIVNKNYC